MPSRTRRLWAWAALTAILIAAAGLRVWDLGERGYGNPYFSAAVRSMLENWHNFFFDAFDPAGFVSVDKPPVALWVQVASAKVLGFSGVAVLLPQALEGLGAVLLTYYLVRRCFGLAAGLLAALFLAVTPVGVAMDRGNGTDSCLLLVLLLGAWAVIRAAETGSRRFFLLAMAVVGLGFNVKMMEALGVVPAFMGVYYAGAPVDGRRRLRDLAAGAVVLAMVSLSWSLAYDLTPTTGRPFVGSSTHNSMLELAAVYNGIDRFIPRRRTAGPAQQAQTHIAPRGSRAGIAVGPLRLVDPRLADQTTWLLPFAIMGAMIPAWRGRWRRPLSSAQLALGLWCGWILTYGFVYSCAGGMFRPYYLLTLAPPLAALAGIGVVRSWSWFLRGGPGMWWLPGALVATAAWQAYVLHGALGGPPGTPTFLFGGLPALLDNWQRWLYATMVGGALAGALGLFVARTHRGHSAGVAAASVALGLAGLLVVPTTWAWSNGLGRDIPVVTQLAPQRERAPGGGTDPWSRFRGAGDDPKLLAFLRANNRTEHYLLATLNAMQAAPLIIETGKPVMALGGFTGRDPILTAQTFADMVAQGQVRFVLIGGSGGAWGGTPAQSALIAWIRAHGRPVDPSLWRTSIPLGAREAQTWTVGRGPSRGRPDQELYDVRPTPTIPTPGPG